METIGDIIIKEMWAYCEEARISPSTLSMRALGSSRFMWRLERKMAKLDEDRQKLRAYMAANPPKKKLESR
jgi:hypothetical protein